MRSPDGDAIEVRIRSWTRRHVPHSVTIGDTTYEFPEGTTREEAQSVLDEAKRRYFALRAHHADGGDSGDED